MITKNNFRRIIANYESARLRHYKSQVQLSVSGETLGLFALKVTTRSKRSILCSGPLGSCFFTMGLTHLLSLIIRRCEDYRDRRGHFMVTRGLIFNWVLVPGDRLGRRPVSLVPSRQSIMPRVLAPVPQLLSHVHRVCY